MLELKPLHPQLLVDIALEVDASCKVKADEHGVTVFFATEERAKAYRDDVFSIAGLDVYRNSICFFSIRLNTMLVGRGNPWVVSVGLDV